MPKFHFKNYSRPIEDPLHANVTSVDRQHAFCSSHSEKFDIENHRTPCNIRDVGLFNRMMRIFPACAHMYSRYTRVRDVMVVMALARHLYARSVNASLLSRAAPA